MANEFYAYAGATAALAPITGFINQLVVTVDAGNTFLLYLDAAGASNKVYAIDNPSASALGFVISVRIPVKIGQKVLTSQEIATLTISP